MIKKLVFAFLILAIAAINSGGQVRAADDASISLTSEGNSSTYAPGEFLSFSIKLVNFGSLKRGDVGVTYQIIDKDVHEVYASSETVAVDTTASFVKRLPLPTTIKAGSYYLVTNLTYPGQDQPAVSKFSFKIENKIGNIFTSQLIIWSLMVGLIIFVIIVIAYILIRRSRSAHSPVFDYTDKPMGEMVYYEILSDMISQMRKRVGNDALAIAEDIPDLEINPKNGKIINIKKEPAKIIALLVFRFEKLTGQKLSFGLRQK